MPAVRGACPAARGRVSSFSAASGRCHRCPGSSPLSPVLPPQVRQHAFRERFREKAPFSYTDPDPYKSLNRVRKGRTPGPPRSPPALPGHPQLHARQGLGRDSSVATTLPSPPRCRGDGAIAGAGDMSLAHGPRLRPLLFLHPATEEHCRHGERHGSPVQVGRAV